MRVDYDFAGIGAATFSLFRSRLLVHNDDQALLEATLDKAVQAGLLAGSRTAIIDSSPASGAGATADTYTLIRKLLDKLVRVADGLLDEDTVAVAAPYMDGKPDIDWHDAPATGVHPTPQRPGAGRPAGRRPRPRQPRRPAPVPARSHRTVTGGPSRTSSSNSTSPSDGSPAGNCDAHPSSSNPSGLNLNPPILGVA